MKQQKQNNGYRGFLIVLLVVLAFVAIYALVYNGGKYGDEISPTKAIELIDNGEVTDIYAYNSIARIRIKGSKISDKDFPNTADYHFEYTSVTLEQLVDIVYQNNRTEGKQFINFENPPVRQSIFERFLPYLSLILLAGFAFFIIKTFSRSNQGTMSFGKSKARTGENIKVRFTDVAGADEEKDELAEIVEFLKNPKKFTDLGARIPKGVLLVGPPGTGKTLLAKAVAGESNVPFLSISGSDFVEMFVGVGASRVRDLFDQAKKSKPCIIFIDEIDAVGRQRGTGLGGGNDEREQTLNQLLVEMDGFEANEGIIVLAATNRSDVLDPALMRPGRFDRQIYVHAPDVKGRESIIKIHARNKPLDSDIDFSTLARITSGFTGADLENMLNEAAILAARANRPKIIMEDLTEGINKVIMGPQKKSRLITERDKKITAFHESGHAILAKLLNNCDEVQEVSIIPRGMAAGYTMSRPSEDDSHMTYSKLNDHIAMIMGGRLAEEIVFKDVSTGASNDIQKATELAKKMVTEWGMSSSLGFMSFGGKDELFLGRDYQSRNTYSEKTASEIDEEIRAILQYNYTRAKKLLSENQDLLDKMSSLLILKETIYKEEVDMLMSGESVETVVKFLDKRLEERAEKEKQGRKEIELVRKIKDYKEKVKTAEMLVKSGVVSPQELDKLKMILKEYQRQYDQFMDGETALDESTKEKQKEQSAVLKSEEDTSKNETKVEVFEKVEEKADKNNIESQKSIKKDQISTLTDVHSKPSKTAENEEIAKPRKAVKSSSEPVKKVSERTSKTKNSKPEGTVPKVKGESKNSDSNKTVKKRPKTTIKKDDEE